MITCHAVCQWLSLALAAVWLAFVLAETQGPAGRGAQGDVLTATPGTRRASRRVAICFFGLTRSLKYTHESVEQNLIAPIRAAGYEVSFCLYS
jgi:hypothetical protein